MKIRECDLEKYSIFDRGERVTGTFQGSVWLNMVFTDQHPLNAPIGNVTFADKAKSYWHYHPKGQVLVVVAGEGWYCEENKEPQLLKRGDVVNVPANTRHWHGATDDSYFVQLALTPGETIWQEPVKTK